MICAAPVDASARACRLRVCFGNFYGLWRSLIVLEGLERKPSVSRRIRDFVRRQPYMYLRPRRHAARLPHPLHRCAAPFRNVANRSIRPREFGFEMGWTARSIAWTRLQRPFQQITGTMAIVLPLYPYSCRDLQLLRCVSRSLRFGASDRTAYFPRCICIPVYGGHQGLGRTASRARVGGGGVGDLLPVPVYFSAARSGTTR